MDHIIYIPLDYAFNVHEIVLETTGGKPGVINENLIASVIEFIQNDDYYPNYIDKLVHLVYGIAKNHAFEDGNKRTALALGIYFLELNCYSYCVDRFVIQMENIIIWVIENKISKEFLSELMEFIVLDEDFPESIQLKLKDSIE